VKPERGLDDAASGSIGGFSMIISVADLTLTTKNRLFLRNYEWTLGMQELKMKRLGLD
jgi:hypothetical protein